MIEARDLVKRFGDATAVAGASLDAEPGICALLGPNGAGKSTLLKLITGLLAPDSGSARICGLDVASHPMEVRRSIGVIPEDLGLFDSLTIEEHLDLCGSVYGLERKEARARAADLLRVLRLDHARDIFLDQCSHGMRKKTALAMALLQNPRVLLLDEPFEGIDPVSSKTIEELLRSAASRGVTVFFTSHILPIVERLAAKILMIRGGKMVWNSAVDPHARPLEEIYFDLVEQAPPANLSWLGAK
ncbi:MAG TPA: ABC transporter ATP-binding protein [Bryobacteraceae bacterium]|nr:ABC transporter ATP-binding protein [Bryobacteraceae bacterium]